METETAEPRSSDPFGTQALALCLQFRACGPVQTHLALAMPRSVLLRALQGYLHLQDDEILLAIVGVGREGSLKNGCALTTKRLYWSGAAAKDPDVYPKWCQSLAYASLPEKIVHGGILSSALDLGDGRRISLEADKRIRQALIAFLGAMRTLAHGVRLGPQTSEPDRAVANEAWPHVVAVSALVRTIQADLRAKQAEVQAFHSRAGIVSRVVVTPVIVLACVGIFLAMVASGASVFNPDRELMLAWGANFGGYVVFDHQPWRLFTCMFLHFGIVHLAMNMYCLSTAGPLMERFLGHAGFAALYVLSGLGGSIASLWVHPTAISAGASGAIFGIFGGLLGYLAIRHRVVPMSVLKPLRAGAVTFVAYNTVIGLGIPFIDMAAHFGGLAVGFVCGLLLTAVSPADSQDVWRPAVALRRVGVIALVAAALAGFGLKAIDFARIRILAGPENVAVAWNAFSDAAEPVFLELHRIATASTQLAAELEQGNVGAARIRQTLDGLKAACEALAPKIQTLPAQTEEIQAVRKHLGSAQAIQLKSLTSLDQFVATGNKAHLEGPNGFIGSHSEYINLLKAIAAIRDADLEAHGLQRTPEPR